MTTPDQAPQDWWNAPTTSIDRATGAIAGAMSGALLGGLVTAWLTPSTDLDLLAVGSGAGAVLMGAAGVLAPKWITAMFLPTVVFGRKR